MANAAAFEARVATAADQTRALMLNLRHIRDDLWSASLGANYEGVYNSLPGNGDIPVGGAITKNQMNNAISAIDALIDAYEAGTVSESINIVAEFAPDVLNNGA